MKKTLVLLLCGVLMALLFAACGNGGSDDGHEEITIWFPSDPNDFFASHSDNPIVQYLNERFNVTITFEQPATGTEGESMSLMFATGQTTDLIFTPFFGGSIEQLHEDGVILDLYEYMDYMPNLRARMEASPELRRWLLDDEGRMLGFIGMNTMPGRQWSGLAYRRDILEIMTDGNIQFPSGNDEPVTIADWDYMLPLFQEFFRDIGLTNYAPLLIPHNGMLPFGILQSGFGFAGNQFYVYNGVVSHGFLDDGLYNFLTTMNRWWNEGFIDPDFAGRVGEIFFLGAAELAFGGAAGIRTSLYIHLDDALSMPEHGLYMDVHPMRNPVYEGVSPTRVLQRSGGTYEGLLFMVASSTQNVPRLLSIIDFLYSDEGSKIAHLGLTYEQIPEADTQYRQHLPQGAWWFEGNEIVLNPDLTTVGGHIDHVPFTGQRLPHLARGDITNDMAPEVAINADRVWAFYDSPNNARGLPGALSLSVEDDRFVSDMSAQLNDFVDAMIPRFIMGAEAITQEAMADFRQQVLDFGMSRAIEIQQEAYDRFAAR